MLGTHIKHFFYGTQFSSRPPFFQKENQTSYFLLYFSHPFYMELKKNSVVARTAMSLEIASFFINTQNKKSSLTFVAVNLRTIDEEFCFTTSTVIWLAISIFKCRASCRITRIHKTAPLSALSQ